MAKATIRSELLALCMGSVEVSELDSQLKEKRGGTYTHAVKAAMLADGNPEAFLKACNKFEDEIRKNTRKVAEKLKCERGKATKKNPVAPYKIPGSLRAAKSYMADALKYGVNLENEDGDARAYTAIRSDVQTIKKAEREAALTGDDKTRLEVLEDIDAIRSRVEKAEGDNLEALRKIVATALVDTRKAFGIDAEREQVKAKKAEAEAEKIAEAA